LADIILVCGFDSKKIIKYVHSSKICNSIKIIENTNYKSTSSLSSFKLAINAISNCNIFIIHGDRIFNNEAIHINDIDEAFVVIDKNNKNKESIGIAHQNNILKNMSYGLEDKWAELFYIPSSLFSSIRNYCNILKSNSNIYELINILNDSSIFKISNSTNIKIQEI
jgi:choline kinase